MGSDQSMSINRTRVNRRLRLFLMRCRRCFRWGRNDASLHRRHNNGVAARRALEPFPGLRRAGGKLFPAIADEGDPLRIVRQARIRWHEIHSQQIERDLPDGFDSNACTHRRYGSYTDRAGESTFFALPQRPPAVPCADSEPRFCGSGVDGATSNTAAANDVPQKTFEFCRRFQGL